MGGVAFPARRQTRLWVAHNRDSLVRVQRMQISEQQGAFRRGFGPASGPSCASTSALRRGEKKSLRSSSQHQGQVPADQDPLGQNPSTVVQVSHWNQGVLDERGRVARNMAKTVRSAIPYIGRTYGNPD